MGMITDIKGGFLLNNGVTMPYLGLGTYMADNEIEVVNAIDYAVEAGYRHIDTAAFYENEAGVGKGIKESGLAREEFFVVSKVQNKDQGYDNTLRAFEKSLGRFKMDYLDLYLIHWPVSGMYRETWRALETLYRNGKVRAIGASNFLKHHLEDLMQSCEVVPAVNQMEFHPYLVQQDLIDFCIENTIQYESWSPFMQGKLFSLPELRPIAAKYGKSIAQIVLRWNLQKGVIAIPKSVRKERIFANAEIFDFALSEGDIAFLDNLDQGFRIGPDPVGF